MEETDMHTFGLRKGYCIDYMFIDHELYIVNRERYIRVKFIPQLLKAFSKCPNNLVVVGYNNILMVAVQALLRPV